MPGFFYTGTRGGGKTLGAVHTIQQYIKEGRRVATNLDLYLDKLLSEDSHADVTRIPDKPNADHLNALGMGCIEQNKKKFGLLVFDEISLYLNSKRDEEYKDLIRFLVLSRKRHWDLLFIAQSKEQVEETLYKSLCDNLIVCKADDLIPIPYFGSLLRMFGFSGNLSEGHTLFKYNGRNELGTIIDTQQYSSKHLKHAYNTDQEFYDGYEVVGEELIDFRAPYTLLPPNILSGNKFINEKNADLKKLKTIYGDKKMAINQGDGVKTKLKIGLLVGVVALIFIFKNPLDNKLFAGENPVTSGVPASNLVLDPELKSNDDSANELTYQQQPETIDYIRKLFAQYRPRLAYYIESSVTETNGEIEFYDQQQEMVQRVSFFELKNQGYAIATFAGRIKVRNDDFQKVVNRWIPKAE